jgi:hypothetical protein
MEVIKMKNFNNKLLMIIALSTATTSIMPHGGGGFGGGFATGALTGALITTAATSGSRRGDRDPAYYDYKDRQYQRMETNREIRRHQAEIRDHKKELRKLDRNQNLDDQTRESRRKEHRSAITDIENLIEDLRADLRSL